MKIRYIFHDCFTISTPEVQMIFDYWMNDPVANQSQSEDKDQEGNRELPVFIDSLDPEKPLYVFVSHSHKDHFTYRIFEFATRFRDIRYIMSREAMKRCRHIMSPTSVYKGCKISASHVVGLSKGEDWSDSRLHVHALGSTDIGVSFMIDCAGRRIFHAGDFNAWLWLDESTPEEIRQARNKFNTVLDDIIAHNAGRHIDVAFFPVDSRIGSGYFEGAREFVRRLDIGIFFPMHCGIGSPAEQLVRKRDAARFDLYRNPSRGLYVAMFDQLDAVVIPDILPAKMQER